MQEGGGGVRKAVPRRRKGECVCERRLRRALPRIWVQRPGARKGEPLCTWQRGRQREGRCTKQGRRANEGRGEC